MSALLDLERLDVSFDLSDLPHVPAAAGPHSSSLVSSV